MVLHGWIALAVLVVAAVLFLTRWVRIELTALAIPVVLFATGTIDDPDVVLMGFGNQAVIAIAAVFFLGAGLQESGVAAWIARTVLQAGGGNELRITLLVCSAVAFLSAFMSNAATVAVLLPAILALTRKADLHPARLLMPLGFAAILGGNLTLIGTASNLLVSSALRQQTGAGFGMFDFALVGLPIVLVGILYLALVGRPMLARIRPREAHHGVHLPEQIAREYGLAHNLIRVRIGKASKLQGKTLAASGIGSRYGLSVVLLERRGSFGTRWTVPEPNLVMEKGDDLYLEGNLEDAWRLAEEEETRIGLSGEHQLERVLDHGVALAEVAVAPRAAVVGQSLRDLDFRLNYGLSVLALWRGGEPITQDLADRKLEVGDALLVAGPSPRVRELGRSDDFLVLFEPAESLDYSKAPMALVCLAVALLPPLLGWAPLALSALGGAVLMIGSGSLSRRGAARAVDWKVLALIVGTLPLGHALDKHGVAQGVAEAMVGAASGLGTPALYAAFFGLAALVSITSSNAAAAVILSPVAVRAAESAGADVRSSLLAVAYGCSCAFLVPFAHQCNLMVMVPGGYRTRDFFLVGSGLSLLVAATAVAGLALLVG